MRIHLIAIGGAVMHNLALALHQMGYEVSGSDDEIFDPAKSRLANKGLLPEKAGWFPSKITSDLDLVLLGMHARQDNPELLEAIKKNIPVQSFPEFLYENSRNKTRVVIGGSHGKTTTTSMIMHVLKQLDIDFDYMVGSSIDGFENMVRLSKNAKLAVFEGDEYLSSPIDRRPKFHLYKAHIGMITGIAWDHINVFPTFSNYLEQFSVFLETMENGGRLIYFEEDENLKKIVANCKNNIELVPYREHDAVKRENRTYLITEEGEIPLGVFGKHNLQNLNGALQVCRALKISDHDFYRAISSFGGAARRLQKIRENNDSAIFVDFAHSPSKLRATVNAVKEQFPGRKLIACMELHTFSSLNKNFLPQYENCMIDADEAVVYYSLHTLEHKKLPPITKDEIHAAFKSGQLQVMNQAEEFKDFVHQLKLKNTNLLLMSSGNFSGINFKELAGELIPEV